MPEPTTIDLHGAVPEPPDDLLGFDPLHRKIRRRRRQQMSAAIAAVVVVAAGSLVAATQLGSHHPGAHSASPAPHSNGDIYFTRTTRGPFRGLPDSWLYRVGPTGGSPQQVTHQPGRIMDVETSPNGQEIAYLEDTYSTIPDPHVSGELVHVAAADGSNDRVIQHCKGSYCDGLLWSPNGTLLLIADATTKILEPDGQLKTLCRARCPIQGDASWSPDGKKLAFTYAEPVSTAGGTAYVSSIATADANGSDLALLTNTECSAAKIAECTSDDSPSWSPDGTTISFIRSPVSSLEPAGDFTPLIRPQRQSVDLIRPDGRVVNNLYTCQHPCGISNLAWSPSGRRLAGTVEGESLVRPHSGEELVVLYAHPRAAMTRHEPVMVTTAIRSIGKSYFRALAWAPDNSRLLLFQDSKKAGRGIYSITVLRRALSSPDLLVANGGSPLGWLPAAG